MGKKEDNIKQIIDILKNKGPKTKKQLAEALNVPKNTLTGYINELRKRGLIKDGGKGVLVELLDGVNYPALTREDVVEWIILYILEEAKTELTEKQIKITYAGEILREDINPKTIEKAIPSLKKYLNNLMNQGLIKECKDKNSETVSYKLAQASPLFLYASLDDLENFLSAHEIWNKNDITDEIAERIEWFTEYDKNDISQQRIYGRYNRFKEGSLKQLNKLMDIPFRTRKVDVSYKTHENKNQVQRVAIGLIIYSGETNEFYIVGETTENKTIIRLSSIVGLEPTDIQNRIYYSSEYRTIARKMMSVELGNPFDVRVRFRNTDRIKNQLQWFVKERVGAALDTSYNNGNEILYSENNVIGLWGMQRFIRTFGPDALVEEPAELRELMIKTANYVEARYNSDNDDIWQ